MALKAIHLEYSTCEEHQNSREDNSHKPDRNVPFQYLGSIQWRYRQEVEQCQKRIDSCSKQAYYSY